MCYFRIESLVAGHKKNEKIKLAFLRCNKSKILSSYVVLEKIPTETTIFAIRNFAQYYGCHRLVFSRFFDLRGNLLNVKEKPTRKTCFSREKKRLAPRIYQAKFCLAAILCVAFLFF